jgi:pyrimidine deaminase RibD-like protein
MFLVDQATSNHFRRKDARIEYVEYEENFESAVDLTAQKRLEDIILGRQGYYLDDEYQTVNFRVISSRDGSPLTSGKGKRVASVASQEIFRHYSLTKRALSPRAIDNLPPLIASHRHSLTNFINVNREYKLGLNLSLLDANSVTGYFKLRHHVLCNADSRRWMELAVSKLRESAEKTRQGLLEAAPNPKTKESDRKSPASVAVAVYTSGKVYTFFRGVDETKSWDSKHQSITQKRHSEDSHISDLIKDELPMLKGGTLYITHEPCGRSWDASEGRDREAIIPCEVRYVEAGFSQYYVGSLDYGNTARGNGLEVLRTGVYAFKREQGDYASEDAAAGSTLLEKYFQKKGYLLMEDTEECRKYKIGEPANVSFFDADLMFEIYKLNAGSQRRQGHGNGLEPRPDIYK